MEYDHGPHCFHCSNGCQHPHEENDPITVSVNMGTCIPAVRGSRMRHGGTFTDPETGLVLSGDRWVRSRCGYCGEEAMTPQELVPPWAPKASDGSFLHRCMGCASDEQQGYTPGHNPHRRRRRGRHG